MKVREVISMITAAGILREPGSHRHFKHPSKPGIVTVAGNPSVDVPPGTLHGILHQAGLR
jgi:predicted RNA binding protein YcfA (HicA-like mRNA interferase family)